MKGSKSKLVLVVGVALVAGCRLGGTWTMAEFDPPPRHGSRAVAASSFARDGRDALTESVGDANDSSMGKYSWNGLALELVASVETGTQLVSYAAF